MWMVNTKILCRKHLLGEHNEIHKLVGSLKRKRSIAGYVQNNCVEVTKLEERHQQLVKEMLSRGYKHQSPIIIPDLSYLPLEHYIYQVSVPKNLMLLYQRCAECKQHFRALMTSIVNQNNEVN